MLITDKIIYLQLHKTGCTHTYSILKSMYPTSSKTIGKHNKIDTIPKDVLGDFNEKIKVGNIRNPWDWYVSLWAYGCQKKGGLYSRLAKNHKQFSNPLNLRNLKSSVKALLSKRSPNVDSDVWRNLYSDPRNYDNFNSWIQKILSNEKFYTGEGYKENKISDFAGLLTYRYINFYTLRGVKEEISSMQKLIEYDKNMNFLDVVIKNESIHDDIFEFSKSLNYDSKEMKFILNNHSSRTNSSVRERNYQKIYSTESKALVEKFDKLIIDKYNYTF